MTTHICTYDVRRLISRKTERRHAGQPGEGQTVYMKGECAVDDPDGLNIPGFIDKVTEYRSKRSPVNNDWLLARLHRQGLQMRT
eukprot:1159791-Pelagomonas_calceolata.AAC.1